MIILPKINPTVERYIALHALLKENFEELTYGAEIGVRHGETAEYLLKRHPKLFLNLIDPYHPYLDIHEMLTAELQASIKAKASKRLESFNTRIRWIYEPSVVAVSCIPDRSLDFAFIDASHRKEAVYEDCVFWYPKVRTGGILCGHDYCHDPVRDGVLMFRKSSEVQRLVCEGDIWVIQT